jgi:hypothetical protein
LPPQAVSGPAFHAGLAVRLHWFCFVRFVVEAR